MLLVVVVFDWLLSIAFSVTSAVVGTGGHIVITSEQAVFDKMVPMATFDVVVV